MINSVIREFGTGWVFHRTLYNAKLRMLSAVPAAERLFEHKTGYPDRLDLFKTDTNRIKAFLRKLPDDRKTELIGSADDACKGIIKGFSSIRLDYGRPIDWQLNPITGKRCSIKDRWYRIPDFDKERGDIKVIWEASRFSHFLTLARAYLLTENEAYYHAFSEQLSGWIDDNPYGYGANYKCGQECALRMVNALLTYTVFRNADITEERDQKNMEALILRCYRRIRSNFYYADKCIRNNHTISELMGLIAGSWSCREENVLAWAYRKLDAVIKEQFTEDGGYCQYSFNYERLALQDIEAVIAMEESTGYRLNDESRERILAAAELMYQCQDGTGDMPNYGANDGALVFPVTACGYRDFRPVIKSVSALLGRGGYYPEGEYDEEYLWFSGVKPQPADTISDMHTERESVAFRDAGLYTLRGGNAWMMAILNHYRFRPGHMDQLHLDLWVDGINVFCDGGTFSYAGEEGFILASNESHNTAVYDHRKQMKRRGAFLVYDRTKCGRIKHSEKLFYGKMISQNGYAHIRKIICTEGGFKITDEVLGENETICSVIFHTPCNVQAVNGSVLLSDQKGILCQLSSQVKAEISDAYRSLYYLKKENTQSLCYTGRIRNGSWKHELEIMIERRNAA